MNSSTYLQQAAIGAQSLQTWYNSGTGLYASPAGWWNAANAVTALVNFEHVAHDATYISAIANTFAKAQTGSSGHPNFTNDFYDDTGWWGLAWIDAYDLTDNPAYLSMAETIFTYMTTGWDTTTCGGGMWWSTSHTYKNAITNELFLTMAAKLANRTRRHCVRRLSRVGAEGMDVVPRLRHDQRERPHQRRPQLQQPRCVQEQQRHRVEL